MKFHEGEKAVQNRLGVRDMAERIRESIHTQILPGALEWLPAQRLAAATTIAPDASVWVSLLTGPAGFLTPIDETTLRVRPEHLDPLLQSNLAANEAIGLIVMEPALRRRLRLNGTAHTENGDLTITAREVYANCPKYIQKRHIVETAASVSSEVQSGVALSDAHRQSIERADTFFIGSSYEGNADASHRGGNPGFVKAVSDTQLTWLDYPGNTMFNTFGNLSQNPRCGLLFIDWENGRTLQISGRVELDYGESEITVQFHLDQWRETAQASSMAWQLDEYSPFNPNP